MNQKRSAHVELDADDARYILHALSLFKSECKQIISSLDEDDDLVAMYGNDIMITKAIHERIWAICEPVFGRESLVVSHELI